MYNIYIYTHTIIRIYKHHGNMHILKPCASDLPWNTQPPPTFRGPHGRQPGAPGRSQAPYASHTALEAALLGRGAALHGDLGHRGLGPVRDPGATDGAGGAAAAESARAGRTGGAGGTGGTGGAPWGAGGTGSRVRGGDGGEDGENLWRWVEDFWLLQLG